MSPRSLLLASVLMITTTASAMAQEDANGEAARTTPPVIEAGEWSAYAERFVTERGRVLDDANDGISHSEGQGYGMLLAELAGNLADFERIWSFTRTELLLRDDGLAAWKWEEDASPNVTDVNNASDGDILIAYALVRAGESWRRPQFTAAARELIGALAATSIYEHEGRTLLRPGVDGFSAQERPDGPVVNLSYWVFEAFARFETLSPDGPWGALARSGEDLVREVALSPRGLPPEWLSLGGAAPEPAEGFPAQFAYNALRIPLYLIRGGVEDGDLLGRLRDGMRGENGGLALVDLATGAVEEELTDVGYRILPAMTDCVLDGTPIAADLAVFEPTVYYPSTLQLLALAHLRTDHPECLP